MFCGLIMAAGVLLTTCLGSGMPLLLGFSLSCLVWSFVFLFSACRLRDIVLMVAVSVFVYSGVMVCSSSSLRLSAVYWYFSNLRPVSIIIIHFIFGCF